MSDSEDDVQPPPPITVTQPGPHTNELLCYVVCKLHICTFDVIVKLCTDFYSLDDVREARELLSNCTVLPDGDRRINRRAANCKEVHMKDIVSILLEVRPVDMPVFLAKNLNNVPPMSLNNFDMSRIITDIDTIKAQMKVIQEAQETALTVQAALCTDAAQRESAQPPSVHSTPSANGAHPRPENIESPASLSGHEDHDNPDEEVVLPVVEEDPEDIVRLARIQGCLTQSPRRHHRDALSPASTPSSNMSYAAAVDQLQDRPTGSSEGQRDLNRGGGGSRPRENNRGFHQGSSRNFNQGGYRSNANKRRKDEDVITGEGDQFNLRAANPYQRKRQCIGIFVSRIRPDYRGADVAQHVLRTTGLRVKCVPIPTRYKTYSSYFIPVNSDNINKLLNRKVWPRGVLVKVKWIKRNKD